MSKEKTARNEAIPDTASASSPVAADVTRTESPKASEPVYGKRQLVKADMFARDRDLLAALLEEGGAYTIAHVTRLIEDYKNRKAV